MAIINRAKASPNEGKTSIEIPIPTASIPTPTWNPRENPLCRRDMPSNSLEAPMISMAIPINIIMIKAASFGYDNAIPANMRINTPSAMLNQLDLPGKYMPTIILSIPTKNKIIANNPTVG